MTDEDDGMIGPLTRRSTFVLALAATLPELLRCWSERAASLDKRRPSSPRWTNQVQLAV
jgi:hypothetical protein